MKNFPRTTFIRVGCKPIDAYLLSFLFATIILLFSCSIGYAQEQTLFSLLSPEESGITFQNNIKTDAQNNAFVYKNFYKGGGVSIGDINNDGLKDIYLTGNQVGDKLYLNKGGLQFEDITQKAGILDKGTWSTHVSMVDINNDGHKDIYVCKSLYDGRRDLRQNELYINNGDLTFTEAAEVWGLNDPFRSTQANFFDYDRDGDFDVFLINQPNPNHKLSSKIEEEPLGLNENYRLLENKGTHFEQVPDNGGVSAYGFGLSSVIADFNQDGWEDIYVANDYKEPDIFFINNKDGTFTNKLYEYTMHIANFSMGSDVADINNDGRMDMVVVDMVAEDNYKLKSNMSGMNPNDFWKNVRDGGHYQYMFNVLQVNNGVDNNGGIMFSDVAQMAGVSNTDWSWSPVLADFDNDGLKDLFVTNGIKHELQNTDALTKLGKYAERLLEKHGFEISDKVNYWQYVDIDSVISYFPSNKVKNYAYKNLNGLKFKKTSDSWGLSQKTFSNGCAYGDLDNDGDLDLVVNNLDEVSFVYRNNAESIYKNNYLRIEFVEAGKARSFFGTKVSLYHAMGQQTGHLTNARGISSSSEEAIHFGLGNINKVDSISIDWTTGQRTVIRNIKKVNALLKVDVSKVKKQGTPALQRNPLFQDITSAAQVNYVHTENRFGDYEREVLLPHRMSTWGSGLAVSDANSDGLEDFFIGGAMGSMGKLFLQKQEGGFSEVPVKIIPDLQREDMGSVFADVDNDGDQDLYVVSGGNESEIGSSKYEDRLYLNNGEANFTWAKNALPVLNSSGSRVVMADYDQDGDLDAFVGGRQVPGHYPEPADSYILKNMLVEEGSIRYVKTSESVCEKLGMVTDAVWTDFDDDGDLDILATGVWMPITVLENVSGTFVNSTQKFNLGNTTGWWFSIEKGDLDGDGDDDFVLGNLGLNYKYKASDKEPFSVHYDDFDDNGKNDIVLSYYNYGQQYPLRGRSCSSQQISSIKKKFKTYDAFAGASLVDVYGANKLVDALHYKAKTFASITMQNLGGGQYAIRKLPNMAQVSNINASIIYDFDKDGIKDIVVAGNIFNAEIETTRNDASMGLFLKGQGNFNFEPKLMGDSGLKLPYDVRDIKLIDYKGGKAILVAVNNDRMRIIKLL